MDTQQRTWWRRFDELPQTLRRVHVWRTPQASIPRGAGGIHPNPTSTICLAGVMRMRCCGGPTLDLVAGDALLIAPGVWHEHLPLRPGCEAFGQGFLMDCSDVCFYAHDRWWGGRLPPDPSRALLEAALATGREDERRMRLRELLAVVAASDVDPADFSAPGLQPMIDRLWSSFHSGLTVDELLRASGLSRSRAYVVFTAGYGATPKAALETMRLWLAAGMLAAGVPVIETAQRCGFTDRGTFTRAWRRRHGTPPAAGQSHFIFGKSLAAITSSISLKNKMND